MTTLLSVRLDNKENFRLNTGKVLSEIGSYPTYMLERKASGKYDHTEGGGGEGVVFKKKRFQLKHKHLKTKKEKIFGKRSLRQAKRTYQLESTSNAATLFFQASCCIYLKHYSSKKKRHLRLTIVDTRDWPSFTKGVEPLRHSR